MKGTLYIQRDKGRLIDKPEPLACEIDLGRDGTSLASVGYTVKARLHKAKVDLISADGLKISGVEEHGRDLGTLLYYQEWWFVPILHLKE